MPSIEYFWYQPGELVVINPETADFGFAQHVSGQREKILAQFGGKVGRVTRSEWRTPAWTSVQVAFGDQTLIGTPRDFRFATAAEVVAEREVFVGTRPPQGER